VELRSVMLAYARLGLLLQTKEDNMASTDFKRITELIFVKRLKVLSVEISLNAVDDKPGAFESLVKLIFNDNDKSIEIESSEEDVLLFAASIKESVNEFGEKELKVYKNTNEFYDSIEFLFDENGAKANAAMEKIARGRHKFSDNPNDIINEFLRDKNRNSKRFSVLKSEYYEIVAYTLLTNKMFVDLQDKIGKKHPEFDKYCKLIDDALMNAFRSDPNMIMNYIKYSDCITLNYTELGDKAKDQAEYVTNLLTMLSNEEKLEGKKGVQFILDIYRRYCEMSKELVNALRITIEIINGNSCPVSVQRYTDNRDIILQNSSYSVIIKCLDPLIRNSESHVSTEIDKKNGKVIFGKKNNVSYTFKEIADMTNQLRLLLPALLVSFLLNELVMLSIIIVSYEYKIMLLGIGNVKK